MEEFRGPRLRHEGFVFIIYVGSIQDKLSISSDATNMRSSYFWAACWWAEWQLEVREEDHCNPNVNKKLKPEEWLEKKETVRNMQTLVFFILQKQTEKTDGIVLYRASAYPSITRVAALLQASKFINHKQHLGLFILWNPASLLIIIWLYGILLIYFVVYTSEFFYFFICLQIILRLLWAFIVRKKREGKYCS